MSAITFLLGILVGLLAIILKEPEFLKELEEENQKSGKCNLNDVECAKMLIQQHLISNVRNFYKTLNFCRTLMFFFIAVATIAMLAYYFLQILNNKQINDNDILAMSFLFLVISSIALLLSVYALLFSLIIRKYN